MAQSLEQFFAEMPPVTKVWFVTSFLSTVAVVLGVVSPYSLLLDFGTIWGKFQVPPIEHFCALLEH